MKRASLKVTPAAAPTEPTDLTDRLLDREAERTPAPAKPKRRAPASRPAATAPAIEPEAPAPVPLAASEPPAPLPPAASLEAALAQAQAASQALEAATQTAPARYSVALRYRLEALAQHLRQVSDFVQRLNHK